MVLNVLLVILVLAFLGFFPRFAYNRYWGYIPFASIGILLALVIALHLLNVV